MFSTSFFSRGDNAKTFFAGCGSFGEINGDLCREGQTLSLKTDNYEISCNIDADPYGVISRKDLFKNISANPIDLTSVKSRFVFGGGEYLVYTQFNRWQYESVGQWQPLNTTISVSGCSIRTAHYSVPFLALWNEQEQRGVAFHLVPNASWEMSITRVETECIVDLGILDYNFNLTLAPGETLDMPEIICYEFKNKTDMDCYKLHNYLHTKYPRRELPVIYDTWMYKFADITYENVSKQIKYAADLGVEYFFIDAGWFGSQENWSVSVGEWVERPNEAFKGRMIDIANAVRAAGMKFGLWFEPERANGNIDIIKERSEYFLKSKGDMWFLDFGNDEAREWMQDIIFGVIDKYGVKYIKDDFNADLHFDVSSESFLKYHAGHKKFMQALRDRYPDLYLSSCGAGGARLEINNYTEFDSSWPTDNESPYEQMRIQKETILRLPPQSMEHWLAVHSLGGFEDFYEPFACVAKETDRMVSSANAAWTYVEGIKPSYLEGLMTGVPIGFSCDLSLLSETAFGRIKTFIANMKKERDFWIKAVARIICDTPWLTAFQYSDMELSKIVVQLFTNNPMQNDFRVYPVVCKDKSYRINGEEIRTGEDILENGIEVKGGYAVYNWKEMYQVRLEVI